VNWERSERFEEFDGCRLCLHWRAGSCAAYPECIPLPILAGQVDHLVERPGQVGDVVFTPIDLEHWRATGERIPRSEPVTSSLSSRAQ
jgi:hypothetical protein